MPNMENVLRSNAGWKFLIKSDLQQSFYQIPLSPIAVCALLSKEFGYTPDVPWACQEAKRLWKNFCAEFWGISYKKASWQKLRMTCIVEEIHHKRLLETGSVY